MKDMRGYRKKMGCLLLFLGFVIGVLLFMKERREIQAVQDRLMDASQAMKQLDSFKLESTQESQAKMGYYLREASTEATFEKNGEDIEFSTASSIVNNNEDEQEVKVYRVSNGDEYVKETEEGSQSEGEWIREGWQVEEDDFYLFQVDEGLRSFHMPDFAAYLEELAEQYADELEVEERRKHSVYIDC